MMCEDNLKRLFEERCEQDKYRLKKADLIMIEATTKDFIMFLEVVFSAIKDRLIKRERQIILTETKLLKISISRDESSKSLRKNKLVLKLKDMRTKQDYFVDLKTKYFAYYMSEKK